MTQDVALEEWRQLQAIVGRLETLEYQIRGWLLLIEVALVAALLAEKQVMTAQVFAAASVAILVAFGFAELMVRVPKREAILRAGEVEASLRSGQYDGPHLSDALSRGPNTSAWTSIGWSEIRVLGFWSFYVPILVVLWVIAASALLRTP